MVERVGGFGFGVGKWPGCVHDEQPVAVVSPGLEENGENGWGGLGLVGVSQGEEIRLGGVAEGFEQVEMKVARDGEAGFEIAGGGGAVAGFEPAFCQGGKALGWGLQALGLLLLSPGFEEFLLEAVAALALKVRCGVEVAVVDAGEGDGHVGTPCGEFIGIDEFRRG